MAEALSLAAFGTSPRLEQFLDDGDVTHKNAENYLQNYVVPFRTQEKPFFAWDKQRLAPFELKQGLESRGRYEGVVLNQEDSLRFTTMSRQQLAALVLKGYSGLADQITSWLSDSEKRAKDAKLTFTRKYGLYNSITRSETAYIRLAESLLGTQLNRPTPEFLTWLDLIGRLPNEESSLAVQLASAWRNYQATVVADLSGTLARIQIKDSDEAALTDAIRAQIDSYNALSNQSKKIRTQVDSDEKVREQIDQLVISIDLWGSWLATPQVPTTLDTDIAKLHAEITNLTSQRVELEKQGKVARGRLDLLTQAEQFLKDHWSLEHSGTCPVCNSDVTDRKGIEAVVLSLRAETRETVESLRAAYSGLQNQMRTLSANLKAAGASGNPLSTDEQNLLTTLLDPLLPPRTVLENWVKDPKRREQLKNDLSRMRVFPESPQPYSDPESVALRLARAFISLSNEADRALDDPQAVGELKKAVEERMEKILIDYLPTTLGNVWTEITLTLTPATWLLPEMPTLKLQKRGKALSVHLGESDLLIRYIYNAAERHILGLAWFFTYHLARRRFEEAWLLLDDSAQEMDQPSFREFVRFLETLLRLQHKNRQRLTLMVTLHQEDRALDVARATNGRLYVLGWQQTQDDSGTEPSVKKVVLLAPGFHPLKPEIMFVH